MIYAATGHRPNKLGGYGPAAYAKLYAFAIKLMEQYQPDKAISGMALGWDTAWAEAALKLGVPLLAAVPFRGQESLWHPKDQEKYLGILGKCQGVFFTADPGYAVWKMQHRNKLMVDASDSTLALWNGTPGGTANCVRYAIKNLKPVINVWQDWLQLDNG